MVVNEIFWGFRFQVKYFLGNLQGFFWFVVFCSFHNVQIIALSNFKVHFFKKFQKQLALNSSSIKAQTDGHVPQAINKSILN